MVNRTWQSFFIVLLAWPGVLTSPSVRDLGLENKTEIVNNEMEWNEVTPLVDVTEASVVTEDLCGQFLDKIDSYLEADSLRADFNEEKPTVQMVLTKILPQLLFGMEQVNTTDIRDAAADLFCKEIELQYYLDDRIRSIGRKISKIWKAGNVGEIVGNIKEIRVELIETTDRLLTMLKETKEDHIKELNILRALENLLNNTTPMEEDLKRIFRYTANLLYMSHTKLEESITSYQTMKTELIGLVVDLKTHDQSLAKIRKDAEKEYKDKTTKGWIKVIVGEVATMISAFTTGFSLGDGEFGAGDIIGPGALAVGAYIVFANTNGIDKLNENHSALSADLQAYIKDVQKYVRISTDVQGILKLQEEAASKWHDIVNETLHLILRLSKPHTL